MGVEFLQKAGRRIKVARDNDLISLVEGDLFTRRMELPSVFELLRLVPGCSVSAGDEVQIELRGPLVVAIKGEAIIGKVDCPSSELVQLLEEHGCTGGRIDEVHAGARVADVEIVE